MAGLMRKGATIAACAHVCLMGEVNAMNEKRDMGTSPLLSPAKQATSSRHERNKTMQELKHAVQSDRIIGQKYPLNSKGGDHANDSQPFQVDTDKLTFADYHKLKNTVNKAHQIFESNQAILTGKSSQNTKSTFIRVESVPELRLQSPKFNGAQATSPKIQGLLSPPSSRRGQFSDFDKSSLFGSPRLRELDEAKKKQGTKQGDFNRMFQNQDYFTKRSKGTIEEPMSKDVYRGIGQLPPSPRPPNSIHRPQTGVSYENFPKEVHYVLDQRQKDSREENLFFTESEAQRELRDKYVNEFVQAQASPNSLTNDKRKEVYTSLCGNEQTASNLFLTRSTAEGDDLFQMRPMYTPKSTQRSRNVMQLLSTSGGPVLWAPSYTRIKDELQKSPKAALLQRGSPCFWREVYDDYMRKRWDEHKHMQLWKSTTTLRNQERFGGKTGKLVKAQRDPNLRTKMHRFGSQYTSNKPVGKDV